MPMLYDSGTLDSSEPQTLRLWKHNRNFSHWPMHFAIGGEIRADENEFLLLLLTSAKDMFFCAGKNNTILSNFL